MLPLLDMLGGKVYNSTGKNILYFCKQFYGKVLLDKNKILNTFYSFLTQMFAIVFSVHNNKKIAQKHIIFSSMQKKFRTLLASGASLCRQTKSSVFSDMILAILPVANKPLRCCKSKLCFNSVQYSLQNRNKN